MEKLDADPWHSTRKTPKREKTLLEFWSDNYSSLALWNFLDTEVSCERMLVHRLGCPPEAEELEKGKGGGINIHDGHGPIITEWGGVVGKMEIAKGL